MAHPSRTRKPEHPARPLSAPQFAEVERERCEGTNWAMRRVTRLTAPTRSEIDPHEFDLVEVQRREVFLADLNVESAIDGVAERDQVPVLLRRRRIAATGRAPVAEQVVEVQPAVMVDHRTIVGIVVRPEFALPRA